MQLDTVESLQRSLKPSQAAKLARVSVDRIYQFCKEEPQRFHAVKVGSTWYIDPDTFKEFAAQERQAGNPNFKKLDD
ncbi:Helix-turn-helix domain protein [Blastopirellula retiformator]|uniref:Helix-turn-helix domain protein n=2 Tax=Blastopirellula retiformator TaxID=2527970 RepID=A0A5C5VJA5_9BACT|nr:Helix-turn-helix domain protein [Blastopirellula retiformator]